MTERKATNGKISKVLSGLHNMGAVDRSVRFTLGALLIYTTLFHPEIIGDRLLNGIVGVFGLTNILASILRICPAYLLVGFSTLGRVRLDNCPHVRKDSRPDGHRLVDEHNIEQSKQLGALRRKLQLSVALPMLALLCIFGTIVFDLNHQFQLGNFTRKLDIAAGLAASALQTEQDNATLSDMKGLSGESMLRTSSVMQEVHAQSSLFLVHDSQGGRLPSAFDRGLENLPLQLAFLQDFKANSGTNKQRGSIHLEGTDYLWTSERIGESDMHVSALMAEPDYRGALGQFASTRFLVIIAAVMWLALWSSTYIVRAFVNRIRDSAAELEHRTRHDVLTGLPNRQYLGELLRERIRPMNTESERLVLLMVDIISFREINDTLGYSLGDQLLIEVGSRLSDIEPDSVTAVRMGGDIFGLVCLTGIEQSKAIRLANQIHDRLEGSIELDGVPVALQVRIGVSSYPQDTQSPDELIRYADIALAQAQSQRLKTSFYQQENDTHSIRKLTLLSRLRSVIEQDQLTLVYQPKIDIQHHRVIGVEVLVRWHDKQYGHVSPGEFINWAEKSGLINKLTRWVLSTANRQCGEWLAQGHEIDMAINLSPTNLDDPKLIPLVNRLMNDGHLGHGRLELEITENAVMEDPENALSTMKELARLGASFAIDDFGTGLSSFTYLRKFPVRNLKIDRAFISEGDENDRDAVLLQSMIELGHSLGCVVTAEGVEDQQSLDRLRDYGCDTIQGFHVCRPLPADEFMTWLENSEWATARKAA